MCSVRVRPLSRALLAAAGIALVGMHAPASAQSHIQQASPAGPGLVLPAWRSPLAGYRSWRDEAGAIGWREANELTARIGGWRAYASEIAGEAPAGAAGTHGAYGAPSADGARDRHGGHGAHGPQGPHGPHDAPAGAAR